MATHLPQKVVGMVGIIDPLRPWAVEAVRIARQAGIEARMITCDHAITASAIGAELGLGPGVISGAEIAAMSDEDLYVSPRWLPALAEPVRSCRPGTTSRSMPMAAWSSTTTRRGPSSRCAS